MAARAAGQVAWGEWWLSGAATSLEKKLQRGYVGGSAVAGVQLSTAPPPAASEVVTRRLVIMPGGSVIQTAPAPALSPRSAAKKEASKEARAKEAASRALAPAPARPPLSADDGEGVASLDALLGAGDPPVDLLLLCGGGGGAWDDHWQIDLAAIALECLERAPAAAPEAEATPPPRARRMSGVTLIGTPKAAGGVRKAKVSAVGKPPSPRRRIAVAA